MLDIFTAGLNYATEAAHAAAQADPDGPTPCDQWTIAALLNHATNGTRTLARVLSGDIVDPSVFDPQAMATNDVGPDRAASFAAAAAELLAAASTPGALDRLCTMPMGELPGVVVANIALLDSVVHGWDLATAAGSAVTMPEPVAQAVLQFAQQMVGDGQRGTLFGPAVDVPASADSTARLVGFLGRRP